MRAETGVRPAVPAQGRQALPYRTAFETPLDFPATAARAREQLRSWLRSKRYDVGRFDDGGAVLARGVVIRYAATDGVSGWHLREAGGDGVTWVSTVAVTRGRQPDRTWVSLNVEPVVSDSVLAPPAAPPRLVRLLLEALDAYDGEAELRHRPVTVGAAAVDDLLDIVCAEDRRLPAVVAAAPADAAFPRWGAVVDRLVRHLPGLASIYLLDPVAAGAFNEGIGSTHRIGPGSVRTYLSGADPAVPEDAVRHRVLSRRRIEAEPARAARVLAVLPRQLAAAAVPPAAARGLHLSIHDVRPPPRRPDDPTAALRAEVALLTELLVAADETERALRATVARQQDEMLGLAADLEGEREGLEQRYAQVRALQQRLTEARLFDSAYTPAERPPPLATSFAELLDRVGQLDPHVTFAGDQSICLDLDEQPHSSAWAQVAWQGLLALADYARASGQGVFAGDFKSWCEKPPDGDWYALSAGKVARDESLTVRRNPKFHQARVFAVPRTVDPGGRVFMGAHIKLGNSTTVAPRMHFHDASHGAGVVYVGYIGPHLPNTLT
ncbi:hypothetical protein GCM10010124_30390 [Pilimelia terevasa]|uniref:Uncharacterized protein n=1 Tax=Pilimelia terevasa TaxID=53372 RepID=A0A8J3BSY7_9ACTN|nr:hypothetical protein [Pilimelia terevasa]GGK35592.1 hypothetical protein GCM10010124_30390 [Pilimelia terevasa]